MDEVTRDASADYRGLGDGGGRQTVRRHHGAQPEPQRPRAHEIQGPPSTGAQAEDKSRHQNRRGTEQSLVQAVPARPAEAGQQQLGAFEEIASLGALKQLAPRH